jgi:hypothetical protein
MSIGMNLNNDWLWRGLSLCVMLAACETLHGIARTVWLAPRVGKLRATQLSIVSGSLLAFGVCWVWVPGFGWHDATRLLGLGAAAALFMASFDVALAHWLLHRPWRRAFDDLNPATGNLLVFGLAGLVADPWLVMALGASSG